MSKTYYVHAVCLRTRQALPQALWTGHRDPSCEDISEATSGEGGIVRCVTGTAETWDFGVPGSFPTDREAIDAAL